MLFWKKFETEISQMISSMIGIESMQMLPGNSSYYEIVFSHLCLFRVNISSHFLEKIIMWVGILRAILIHILMLLIFSEHSDHVDRETLWVDIRVSDHNTMIFDSLFIHIMGMCRVANTSHDERTRHSSSPSSPNKFAISLQVVQIKKSFFSLMIYLLNLIVNIFWHSHHSMIRTYLFSRLNMRFSFQSILFPKEISFIWMYNRLSSIVFLKSYFSFSLSRIQSLQNLLFLWKEF